MTKKIKILGSAATLMLLVATPALANTHRTMREAPVALSASQLYTSDVALRNGVVMGHDPDSHVRFELRRDNPTY